MIFKNFYTKKKIFFIGSVFVIGFLLHSNSASAASTYKSLVQIPCVLLSGCPANPDALNYLSNLYSFLISVVGIVAMGAIVIGGARYLTSVGNPSAIEDAKHTIYSAIYGLILALVSWVIISTINPDILVLKNPAMTWTGAGYSSGAGGLKCGRGDPINGCTCIDGKVFNGGLAPTKIVLTTVPVSPNVYFDATVVLTDASGAPISGALIKINRYKSDFSSSQINFLSPSNTDAAGTTTFWFDPTCDESVIFEAVYAGDATHAPTSATLSLFFTGHGSVCAAFSSSGGSLMSSSGACNAMCSNPADYHCIAMGVRIGWVAGDPASYTDEQLRAMAVNEGTDASPFIAYDGSRYIFEVEKYTTSLYPIVSYTFDGDYNGDCGSTPLTNIGYHKATATYGIEPPPPPVTSCVNSTTPLALTCSQKFCVEDSQGNKADTTIYYSILSK